MSSFICLFNFIYLIKNPLSKEAMELFEVALNSKIFSSVYSRIFCFDILLTLTHGLLMQFAQDLGFALIALDLISAI